MCVVRYSVCQPELPSKEANLKGQYCNTTPLLLAVWIQARLVTSCLHNVGALKGGKTCSEYFHILQQRAKAPGML